MSTLARKYCVVQVDEYTGEFNSVVYVSESYTDAEEEKEVLIKRHDSFSYVVWAVL